MKYTNGLKRLSGLIGWKQFFKTLSSKEKFIFSLFLFLFLSSLSFLLINFYYQKTEEKPMEGGFYIEGVVGSPRWINPVYAPANEIDQDLVELIFSGLMKYDSEGKLLPDLAKKYKILEEGKVYEFILKENLFWPDGNPLTVDDIIFTIKTIQDPLIKSPLRGNWLGVEMEKVSDQILRFKLRNPSAVFLENTALKIIPKHIWENVSPPNFPLSIYNLKPVGSGPYKLKNLIQDREGKIISLDLVRNPRYFNRPPYLFQISFRFFENEEDLILAAQKGEVKGFSLSSIKKAVDLNQREFNIYSFNLPRYFAVFFNPDQSKVLAEKLVRQALNYGTNKKEIVENVFHQQAKIVNSPILSEIYGFREPAKIYQFDSKEAELLLEKAGFLETELGKREKIIKREPAFQFKSNLKLGSRGKEVEELQKCLSKDKEIYPEGKVSGYFGQGTKRAVIRFQERYQTEILTPQGLRKGTGEVKKLTREKLNEFCFEKREEEIPLKFSLTTVNQPKLIEVANLLKEQWKNLGVDIEIKSFDISTLEREIIKPRNYEAILFGKVLGQIPDPFPFWHSSQKKDPGLNLAFYENKESDKLLEEVRQTLDEKKRKESLEKFQDLLIEEAPAIFLYNPDYLYFVSQEIKGIKEAIITEPSKRFINIQNWYIKTKRVWK